MNLAAALRIRIADEETDCDARHDSEHVAHFAAFADVAAEVHYIHVAEFVRRDLAKPVVLARVYVLPIGYERDNPIVREPIGRPADEAFVHVVLVGSLRRSLRDVGFPDSAVNVGVFAVGVKVVPVGLAIVVRRVADDNADGLFVLVLDALSVFG